MSTKPVTGKALFDALVRLAQQKTHCPDFEWLDVDCSPDGHSLVTLGRKVNGEVVAQTRPIIVQDFEVLPEVARWEAETGKCSACGGEGGVVTGWSAEAGKRTIPCAKCGETGRAA